VPGRLAAAALLAAVGAAAGAWLLSPAVVLGPGAGEWREVTSGLRWSTESPTLTGTRRVLVHFHDLTAEPAEVRLVVATRGPADALRLRVERDGERLFDVEAPAAPAPVSIPVQAGARAVDVTVTAEPLLPGARTAYRIHDLALEREASWGRRLAQAVPVVVGCAVLLILWPRSRPGWAVAWAAVALTASLWAIAVAYDPCATLRILPASRSAVPWILVASAWLLALWRPGGTAGAAAVLVTVFGLYVHTLHYGFVNEDFNFARPWTWDDLLATLHGTWAPHGGVAIYYRPVVSWSLALDYAAWGTWMPGYHLVNLAIHCVNGVLALALLVRLGLSHRAAVAGALAWIVHPLAATAVAWTNQRTDALAASFTLGCLLALLGLERSPARWVAVLGCTVLALGSKEMAVSLPILAVSCIAGVHGWRGVVTRRPELVGLIGLVSLYGALWLNLLPEKLALLETGRRWEGLEHAGYGAWLRAPAALYALVFVPTIDYETWRGLALRDISSLHLAAGVLVPAAACLALGRRGSPGTRAAWIGLLWPIAAVGPLLAVPEVDVFRLGLLVALAFALVWGGVVSGIERRSAPIAIALAMVVAASLAVTARRSAAAWGPRGSFQAELVMWRRHVGDRWWRSLTPEMQRLFREHVARRGHERHLIERWDEQP
jgi:hypothetical protein